MKNPSDAINGEVGPSGIAQGVKLELTGGILFKSLAAGRDVEKGKTQNRFD